MQWCQCLCLLVTSYLMWLRACCKIWAFKSQYLVCHHKYNSKLTCFTVMSCQRHNQVVLLLSSALGLFSHVQFPVIQNIWEMARWCSVGHDSALTCTVKTLKLRKQIKMDIYSVIGSFLDSVCVHFYQYNKYIFKHQFEFSHLICMMGKFQQYL